MQVVVGEIRIVADFEQKGRCRRTNAHTHTQTNYLSKQRNWPNVFDKLEVAMLQMYNYAKMNAAHVHIAASVAQQWNFFECYKI